MKEEAFIIESKKFFEMNRNNRRKKLNSKEKEKKSLKRKENYKMRKEKNLKIELKEKEEQIRKLKEKNQKLKEKLIEKEMEIKDLRNDLQNKDIEKEIEDLIDSSKLKKIVRFEKDAFLDMVKVIEPEFHSRGFDGEIKKIDRKTEKNIRVALFITLFWLKNYPTNETLEFIFKKTNTYLMNLIKKTLICLYQCYNGIIEWPTDKEFEKIDEKFEKFYDNDIWGVPCVVDGTEIRVRRPTSRKNQKKIFSGKKKQFSVNVLLVTLLDGRFIFVSDHRKSKIFYFYSNSFYFLMLNFA